jgi:hypothetical protein
MGKNERGTRIAETAGIYEGDEKEKKRRHARQQGQACGETSFRRGCLCINGVRGGGLKQKSVSTRRIKRRATAS